MEQPMIFLKLGGSLLTDKTAVEAPRHDVLNRLAGEIAQARQARPDLRLLLGHGSGSFGHVAGAKHGTRQGVHSPAQWRGLAEVSDAAARLNRLVTAALLAADIPAISLQPSASAQCVDGRIHHLATEPVTAALSAGLLPVVYGDVAFDSGQGGTIISTEEIMSYLAAGLRPSWFLLAGETEGVLDGAGQVIPRITPDNFDAIAAALGGSRGADVTGGMRSKVQGMLALTAAHPTLRIRIFSGLTAGNLTQLLQQPEDGPGTVIAVNE
jgi:isopentenyl phosphate kinase